MGILRNKTEKQRLSGIGKKATFVAFKTEHHLPCQIDACDIIPLVNNIFHKYYSNTVSNKKAVADRGWYPANRALVEHPLLVRDKEPESTPNSLNFDEGMGAAALDRLLHHRARSEGGRKAAEKRKAAKEGISKNILDTRKLTAGVITGNGIHSLNDPRFLVLHHERRRRKKEKQEKSAKTK